MDVLREFLKHEFCLKSAYKEGMVWIFELNWFLIMFWNNNSTLVLTIKNFKKVRIILKVLFALTILLRN